MHQKPKFMNRRIISIETRIPNPRSKSWLSLVLFYLLPTADLKRLLHSGKLTRVCARARAKFWKSFGNLHTYTRRRAHVHAPHGSEKGFMRKCVFALFMWILGRCLASVVNGRFKKKISILLIFLWVWWFFVFLCSHRVIIYQLTRNR